MNKEITILTDDDIKLSASLFIPEQPIKAGVIINSATAVKQGFYTPFAEYLASNGYLVLTYDYRGIGLSAISNSRDKRLTMQAWGQLDLKAVIEWAAQQYSDIEWHCIGHSVGGQIIGFADNNSYLKSVYCVSAQSGYWNHWQSLGKIRMLAMWYAVVPGLAMALGKVPGMFLGGESLPEGIARQWAYWGRHKEYIVDQNSQPIREGFERLQCPMKFLLIDDDKDFAPPNAVQSLKSFYSNAFSELEIVDAKKLTNRTIGHFGFFRKHHKTDLWLGALNWLDNFKSERSSKVVSGH